MEDLTDFQKKMVRLMELAVLELATGSSDHERHVEMQEIIASMKPEEPEEDEPEEPDDSIQK